VEQIARNHDRVGLAGDEGSHRASELLGHVRLAPVHTLRREALELTEPEVGVGQVGDAHAGYPRVAPGRRAGRPAARGPLPLNS
jgi:hypothetical protein